MIGNQHVRFGLKKKLQKEKESYNDTCKSNSNQLKFQKVHQDHFTSFSLKKKLKEDKRTEKHRLLKTKHKANHSVSTKEIL